MDNKYGIVIHYILLYLLVISQGAVAFNLFQDFFLVLMFILAVIIIARNYKLLKIDWTVIFVGMLFLYLVFIRIYTKGSMSIGSIGRIVSTILFAYAVYHFDEEHCADRYVKLVTIVSIVSIVFFVVQIIDLEFLKTILPDYEGSGTFYGGIITTYVRGHDVRSSGLATEPGRHQLYVIVALFLVLFRSNQIYLNKKLKFAATLILILAVGIAQSTTGYIALAMVLFIFLIQKKDNTIVDQKYIKWLKLVILGLVLLLLIFTIIGGKNSLIYRTVINKILIMSSFAGSGSARIGSMLTDFSLAIRHPLGMGFRDYEAVWVENKIGVFGDLNSCCGFSSFLTTCGFPGMIIMLAIYIYNTFKNIKYPLERILVWLLLFNLSLGQPCFYYAPMLLVFFLKDNYDVKEKQESI